MQYTVQNYEEVFGVYDNYNEAISLVHRLGDKDRLAFISRNGRRLYGGEFLLHLKEDEWEMAGTEADDELKSCYSLAEVHKMHKELIEYRRNRLKVGGVINDIESVISRINGSLDL